jgi:hypothetical protein
LKETWKDLKTYISTITYMSKVSKWHKEDRDHLSRIKNIAEVDKHLHLKFLEQFLFWVLLATGIISIFLFTISLTPILLVAKGAWSIGLTAFFGLFLGFILVIALKHMKWTRKHHHLLFSLLIPVMSLFIAIFIAGRINHLSKIISITAYQNPVIIGLTFFIAMIIPKGIFYISRRHNHGY